ncbi:MAG: hypothetical protein A2020_15070 [Lentisphaerae bacterium GWF2_45_14]|nr:MAG: hypothetical protein A2020_15070 [Lentisphaerae bacterium GWF2_45_14]
MAKLTVTFYVFFFYALSPALSEESPLNDISRNMERVKTFSAEFEQVKKFKILMRPIRLNGRLYIQRKPFRLAWRVDSPVNCVTVMDADKLIQWDESSGCKSEISISSNPVLKTVTDTYRAMLLGDFSSFEKTCSIKFNSSRKSLTVIPRSDSDMGRFIDKIIFYFSPDLEYLEKIDISEIHENSTSILFKNISINKELPVSAWSIE